MDSCVALRLFKVQFWSPRVMCTCMCSSGRRGKRVILASTARRDTGRETRVAYVAQLLGTLGAAPAAPSSAGSKEERARARASRKSTASCSLRSVEMSCVGRSVGR